MSTIIDGLREIVGEASFYVQEANYSGYWDYSAMMEYLCAVLILAIVISSIFRFLTKAVGR